MAAKQHHTQRHANDQKLDQILADGDECLDKLIKLTQQTKQADSGHIKQMKPDHFKKTRLVIQQHIDDEDIAELLDQSEGKPVNGNGNGTH